MKYTSVWQFPETDQIDVQYKGRCIPEIPRYCIERYSKPNDLVLDVCMGSGTAFVEALKLNRRAIGIEPSRKGIAKTKERLEKEAISKSIHLSEDIKGRPLLDRLAQENLFLRGDSRRIPLPDESVDFAFAHIPYWSVITYTTKEDANPKDISRVWSLRKFNTEILRIYHEVKRVLKYNCYFAVLIGDIRQGGWKVPLGVITTILLDCCDLTFEDMFIKVTDNAISMRRPKVIEKALSMNRTVTIHEYIIIFQKRTKGKRKFMLPTTEDLEQPFEPIIEQPKDDTYDINF
jgi:DNA modification methylase